PILEDPLEAALGEIRLCPPFRDIGQAHSRERSIQDLRRCIVGELAFDAHLQFATAFLKLPGIEPAMGWQAQRNAIVADQVLRFLWYLPSLEVGGSPDNGDAHVRRNAHRD